MRNVGIATESADITISAADPLNLLGIIIPGERVPAISGKFVTLRNGVAVTGEEAVKMMDAIGS
jgi:ATP-dependent Lhr-like helicase